MQESICVCERGCGPHHTYNTQRLFKAITMCRAHPSQLIAYAMGIHTIEAMMKDDLFTLIQYSVPSCDEQVFQMVTIATKRLR